MPRMKKIAFRGLRQHVVNEIGERIVSGELKAGEPLPGEMQLCTTLGVSRTALREALRELAAKGMVDAKPKVGTVVKAEENWNFLDIDIIGWRLKTADANRVIAELYELRHFIEPVAAYLAAKNADANHIALLHEAYREMEAAGEDGEEFTKPDLKFHHAIISASGNRLFSSLAKAVGAALLINFDFLRAPPRGHAYFMKGHKAVLDAIVAGDAVAARLAMQALLKDSHQDASTLSNERSGKLPRKGSRKIVRFK